MDFTSTLKHIIQPSQFEDGMLKKVAPWFWSQFPNSVANDPVESSLEILKVFRELFEKVSFLKTESQPNKHERNLQVVVQMALLLDKPKSFNQVLHSFYTASFNAYQHLNESHADISMAEDMEIWPMKCSDGREINSIDDCELLLNNFKEFNLILQELKLVKAVSWLAISSVVYNELQRHVGKVCKGEFQMHYLPELLTWMDKIIIGWLRIILLDDDQASECDPDNIFTVAAWKPRLQYFLCKVYAELRISQLFEIIVDYPDSLPAITDLKQCLEKTETRGLLIHSIKMAFQNRLLHAAVNTSDILTQYVSAIRTLRALDPSGVILENVCQPLREYLRSREDTIRCIILSLTDQESSTDLAEELLGSDTAATDGDRNQADVDDESWMPDPIDALPDVTSKAERTADIINILVNIYGSKDLFVAGYAILLADRIMKNYSYDVTNERRYLELLKRKFGECDLHFCDIMLKDIQDSQRINRHIKDLLERKFPNIFSNTDINAFILSAVFWPSFKKDSVELPESLQSLVRVYTEEFEASKGMRTLEWINNLGEVELEIELNNGKKNFIVTPAQACVILKFQDQEEWSLSQLSNELKVNSNMVRSRLSYWINKGIISEHSNEVFTAAKSYPSASKDLICEADEEDSVTAPAQNQKDEEMEMYWFFVIGMITNMGSLPLDRIHAQLKMFATQGTSNGQLTQEDVKHFLQTKVQAGKLCFANGLYRLPQS